MPDCNARTRRTPTKASRRAITPAGYKVPKGSVLCLRTCAEDITSYKGLFQWPVAGPVSAPDWSEVAECGNGLHGFLWGEGNGELASWDANAKWLVVQVVASTIVSLDDKVKFPAGEVVFCGDRIAATEFLAKLAPGKAIVGGTATAGVGGTLLVKFYDTKAERYRIVTGYVGEDGLLPNREYLIKDGKLSLK